MKQRYNWQIIFLIKFLQSEFTHPFFKTWLFESLTGIVKGANLEHVVVSLAIETDLPIDELLETVPTEIRAVGNRYFLALEAYGKGNTGPATQAMNISLKGTYIPLKVIDFAQSGGIQDAGPLGVALTKLKENIDSDHTMVVTWDHGSAYGIFYEPDANRKIKNIFSNGKSIEGNGETKFFDLTETWELPTESPREQKFINEISGSYFVAKNPNIFIDQEIGKSKSLTMDELATALKVLPGSKVDILLMVNCSMMTIDTQYALRDCVDYLIAPESFIPFQTYYFKGILNYLTSSPGVSPVNLGEYIIKEIPQSPIFAQYPEQLDNIAVAMVNLNKLKENNTWLAFFNLTQMLDQEAENKLFLIEVQYRRRLFTIIPLTWGVNQTSLHLCDAISILNEILQIYIISPQLKNAISNFLDIYIQGSEINATNRKYIGKIAHSEDFRCTGVSLFFPALKLGFEKNNYILLFYNETTNNVNISAIARDTYWNNFLFKYYGAVE